MATQEKSIFFNYTGNTDYDNFCFKFSPSTSKYYSPNNIIKSTCAATKESKASTQSVELRSDSIYYVANNFERGSQLFSISNLIPDSKNLTNPMTINLNDGTIALLLKLDQNSNDLKLLVPPEPPGNPYSFLDRTLTWKSQSGDTIVGGEIIAIKDDKNIKWKNKTLLGAIDATLRELDDTRNTLESDAPAIHSPQQKIIFGPPGTGKSYSVGQIKDGLYVNNDTEHKEIFFRTTFHPEYSYGDFVAKLLPLTVPEDEGKRVEYQIHAGPFIQALAKALSNDKNHVLLVIDEINRGNCAAIFGDTFQLLDRNNCGESEYEIDPSELTRLALKKELREKLESEIAIPETLRIPANLSIVATMNTSDESVFYMDSAFKRRWQFQYIGPNDHEEKCKKHANSENDNKCPSDCKEGQQQNALIRYKVLESKSETTWEALRKAVNGFLLKNSASVRRIEDKQLGLWFIKAKENSKGKSEIAHEDIQFKLMHYLWDNVFARDKEPLRELLGLQKDEDKTKLVTFGQFADKCDNFLKAIIDKYPDQNTETEATQ